MKICVAIGMLVLSLGAAAESAHACSTVYFEKNGQTLLGHNMDWFADRLALMVNKRQVKKHGFVFPNDPEFTWTSKYGSISLVMEGREITGRGMNEAGLVILEMALGETQQSTDGKLPRLSVGQWAQYQLDTSATIEDVIASDKVVRISPEEEWQSQFLLWDRTGTVALLAWLEGKLTLFKGDALPVPIAVNYSYESCLSSGDDPTGRFKKMSDRYAAYDPAKDRNGFEFVYSVLQEGADMMRSPLRTLWQFILDPRAQRMSFYSFDNKTLRYVDLKDFDFSCETPVEVFDLSKGAAGNVRPDFVPYTTTFNTELTRYIFGIYDQYGIPTSDELIEKIIAFPESTTCVKGSGVDAGTGRDAQTTSTGGTGGSAIAPGTGGTTGTGSVMGTGGTLGTGGASPPKNSSASCSCRLAGPRESWGLGAGLILLGMVAWYRARRR